MLDNLKKILYELCYWDNCLSEKEYIINLKSKCKTLYLLADSFRNKYDELNLYAHSQLAYKEECIQSKAMSRGYYHSNPISDMVVGGCKRGKISKNAKKPCFEYWFDEDKNLIYSVQFDYYHSKNDKISESKTYSSCEYIIYLDKYQIGLLYNIDDKSLVDIEICEYDGKNILFRINTDEGLVSEFGKINNIHFEQFNYSKYGISKYYEYNYREISKELFSAIIEDWHSHGNCEITNSDYLFIHNEITFYRNSTNNRITHYIYDEFKNDKKVSTEEYKPLVDINI